MAKDKRLTLNLKVAPETKEALERLRADLEELSAMGNTVTLTAAFQHSFALLRRYVDDRQAGVEWFRKGSDGKLTRMRFVDV